MPNVRHPVLDARIPSGGFGRSITMSEQVRLGRLGVCVPDCARVVRAWDCDYVGALYVPREDGMVALDVSVTVSGN